MFKLVVLFTLVAVATAVAKPGYLGGHLGYSAPIVHSAPLPVAAHSVAFPAAVSSIYRKDIISKPIVTYTAPIVQKTIVAAPALAYSAPISYAAHVPSVHSW
ncbi:uncharacterized protein LOC109604144 [Aethina tumida]|uniref:uncharacterized protein LOC109604144 n=1 Tax=Aethina tumida TaxID=116153 RepID=UPI00096B5A72|nr:uncharacterized protein LOC109604144 [Aethina tumida]